MSEAERLAALLSDMEAKIAALERRNSIADGHWVTPSLLSGWVPYGTTTPYSAPGYMRDGRGLVHTKGLVKNGADFNAPMFVLPRAYAPDHHLRFFGEVQGGLVNLIVLSKDVNDGANAGGGSLLNFGGGTTTEALAHTCFFPDTGNNTPLTLLNSWAEIDPVLDAPPGYRLDSDGLVWLSGYVTRPGSTPSGSVIAVLPEEARPSPNRETYIPALVLHNGTTYQAANLTIRSTGDIEFYNDVQSPTTVTFLSLNVPAYMPGPGQAKFTDITAFSNGWVNFGDPYARVGYYIDQWGFCHLQGVIKSGTVGGAMFQLPSGARPKEEWYQQTQHGSAPGGSARLIIQPSGVATYSALINTAGSLWNWPFLVG